MRADGFGTGVVDHFTTIATTNNHNWLENVEFALAFVEHAGTFNHD